MYGTLVISTLYRKYLEKVLSILKILNFGPYIITTYKLSRYNYYYFCIFSLYIYTGICCSNLLGLLVSVCALICVFLGSSLGVCISEF